MGISAIILSLSTLTAILISNSTFISKGLARLVALELQTEGPSTGIRWRVPKQCPSIDQLFDKLSDLLGEDRPRELGKLRVDAWIYRTSDLSAPKAGKLRLELGLEDGNNNAKHVIDALSCEELVETTAALIAVHLGPIATTRKTDNVFKVNDSHAALAGVRKKERKKFEGESRPKVANDEASGSKSDVDTVNVLQPETQLQRRRSITNSIELAQSSFRISAAGLAGMGTLPTIDLGIGIHAAFHWNYFFLETGVAYLFRNRVQDFDPVRVDFRSLQLSFSAGPRKQWGRFELLIGVYGTIGGLWASGSGGLNDQQTTSLWAGIGLSPGLEFQINRHLYFRWMVRPFVVLWRPRIVVDGPGGGLASSSRRFGIHGILGLGYGF